jgi:pyruvate-formate lyase-activating enzyme
VTDEALELAPRQLAELAREQPQANREAWIRDNVPAEIRDLVVSHISDHEWRVAMAAEFVASGKTREERAERLKRMPAGARAEIKEAVMRKFETRKKVAA